VAALLDDRALQREFNKHPGLFNDRYGLTPDESGFLYTLDGNEIAAAIATEFRAFKEEVRAKQPRRVDFPACSEEYEYDDSTKSEYPDPKPGLIRLTPREVTVVRDANGDVLPFEIVVTGKSYSRDPDALLVVTHIADGTDIPIESRVFGSLRCSRLAGRLEGALPSGYYQVSAVNSPTTTSENEIPPAGGRTEADFVLHIVN
jgi:hypothetical protein